MAGDVVFDEDIRPYIYLDEGTFWLSLRNKKLKTGKRLFLQKVELHRMGETVDERVRKLKECLQFSLKDAREHFGLEMLSDHDDTEKFMQVIQHRMFFRMLLDHEEIVWVYTGKMLVPMFAVAHRQYWGEQLKEGFVPEYFFRGALFALLHVVENFKIPRHRSLEEPDDPPPFTRFFSPSLPKDEREKLRAAVQLRCPIATILMTEKNKDKDDWKPVRALFEYKPPDDLPDDEVLSWKCTFHDILSPVWDGKEWVSRVDRQMHLGSFYFTVHSKISCLYLPYYIRKVRPKTIPRDVSKIEMQFSDNTAMDKIDLRENLFFYTVATMMFRNRSTLKSTRMMLLEFLIMEQHAYTDNAKLNSLFAEELKKLAEIEKIEYSEAFRWARQNPHVLRFRHGKEVLSLLIHNLEITADVLTFIVSHSQQIRDYVSLLRETTILKSDVFQQAMVNVAHCVFALSETYCGLKVKDEAHDKRKKENLKRACFIKLRSYVQSDTPERHEAKVKDILSEASEITKEVDTPVEMARSYRDTTGVIRGVGGMKDGSNTECNPREIEHDNFFLSQHSIESMFERWFCDALLYHSMPEDIISEKKQTHFLVFLCTQNISMFPKEIMNKIKAHPWNYDGCMRTRPVHDESPNFAAFVNFAGQCDEFVAFPGDTKVLIRSGLDMKARFDEICDGCMNVRKFISSVSLTTFGLEFDTFSYGLPGVGLVKRTHYSWYPRTCDPTNLFGSRFFELTKDFPLEVWSKDVVLVKKGPDTVLTHPVPCSKCMTFSKIMYKHSHTYRRSNMSVDDFRCSSCTPRSGEEWTPEPGWNAVTMYDDFGIVCSVGDSLISTRHIVWTTGWVPTLKSELSSIRNNGTLVPTRNAEVQKKRTPTFLLGWSNKVPKREGSADVSNDLVLDWLEPGQVLCPIWLNDKYVVREKVCLHWKRIFDEVTSCTCCKRLKAWKIKKRFFHPMPLESKEEQDNRLGPRPCPTFRCCGKDVILNSSLVTSLDNEVFNDAIEILDLPPMNEVDRLTLMRCDDFLKLFYTLFSKRGKESSLREACSWRGEGDTPSHCMFFGEETLNVPVIRGFCVDILGMEGSYY